MTSQDERQLDATIRTLNTGLYEAKETAADALEEWTKTLNNAKDPALQALAKELADLNDLLGLPQQDGARIKKALQSIGQHTTAAAKVADDEATAEKVKQLGHLLMNTALQLR